MAAILRTFGIKKSKHKKLPEDWTDCKAPVIEGITFYCKYLGSTAIEEPSSDVLTADAIKRIIQMSRLRPILCRISYCSADATFDRVVAFIATNANETHECHAFLTSKRKIAEATALTISQAFTIAFEKWKQTSANSSDCPTNGDIQNVQNNGKPSNNDQNVQNPSVIQQSFTETPLIDLSDENTRPDTNNSGLGFDDDFTSIRINDNKQGNQLREKSNFSNFEKLHRYVRKEVHESKANHKFFAEDDLFSL